jgi:hypothetical protein
VNLRRTVALKILPVADSAHQERRRRFLREARAATAVVHPNITTIFEVGDADGFDFIAMELVRGETLRKVLWMREGPLEIAEALRIAREVAQGLGKAHEAGIVHRDIKPENVMLGEGGGIKILDFGLAKWVEPKGPAATARVSTMATLEGQILGTPSYMSPEQVEGAPVDARTDVFSLGVMLYEMITGALPFSGATMMAVMIAASRDAPVPVTKRRPDAPRELEQLIHQCIEKDPAARFQDGEALAKAIDALLSTLGSAAASPPEPAPASSRERRRMPTWLGVAGIALLAGAAIVAMLFLRKAPRAAIDEVSQPSAPAPSPSAAAPLEPLLRYPCITVQPGWSCISPKIAWCDTEDKFLACCPKGLVSTGVDGLCACPPGGVTEGPGVPAECPRREEGPSDRRIRELIRPHFSKFRACYDSALAAAPKTEGTVSIKFQLTPEGRVFKAQVVDASLQDPEAQACIVRVFQRLVLDPPTDGKRVILYPISFSKD